MFNTVRNLKGMAVLAACSLVLPAAPPSGWFLAGSKPAEYQCDTDPDTTYNGQPSVYLKAPAPVNGFGTMMQSFSADQYAGKRVRFSAFVESDSIQDWAGLWMRVDKGKDAVAFDNMQNRGIKGTSPWANYSVVLDVPSDATRVSFGILLSGQGSVWISSGKFEVVTTSVPVTGGSMAASDSPKNLSFEK